MCVIICLFTIFFPIVHGMKIRAMERTNIEGSSEREKGNKTEERKKEKLKEELRNGVSIRLETQRG